MHISLLFYFVGEGVLFIYRRIMHKTYHCYHFKLQIGEGVDKNESYILFFVCQFFRLHTYTHHHQSPCVLKLSIFYFS
jgi:hypothetical protein